jgi:hypothetical protein
LYKVPLSHEELFSLDAADMPRVAREPRPLVRSRYAGLWPVESVHAVEVARNMFLRAKKIVRRGRRHPYRFPRPPGEILSALCPARQHMLASDVARGFRNNVAIRLASALRRAGYDQTQTSEVLHEWNRKLTAPLPERELQSVVRSAFARSFPYAYGCHDEVIQWFCPYRNNLLDCEIYRQQHASRFAD